MKLRIFVCSALFFLCEASTSIDNSDSDANKHEKMVPKIMKELEDWRDEMIKKERENCVLRENRWIHMLKDAEFYHERSIATAKDELAIVSTAASVNYNGKDISRRAADGILSKNWGDASCTHVPENTGWWQAGLQHRAKVRKVTLHNRSDCCQFPGGNSGMEDCSRPFLDLNKGSVSPVIPERLSNFRIDGFVRDPRVYPNEEAINCVNFPSRLDAAEIKTLDCDEPIEANFLRIINNAGSSRDGLTLCEFIASGEYVYEERIKELSPLQSSYPQTNEPHSAWRAMDHDQSTCSHTMLGDDADDWWQIDFQENKTLLSLSITNRDDEKYKWLHDIDVIIYEQHPTECGETEVVQHTCATHEEVVDPGETVTLTCNPPVTGRYMRIVKKKEKKNPNEPLSLCQVDVHVE